jgi:hypothetical protein
VPGAEKVGGYGLIAIPLAVMLLAIVAACAFAVRRSVKVAYGQETPVNWTEGHSWLAAALGLTLLFAGANHPLLRGMATGIWDADGQFFPYFALVSDHVKHAQFVTWDLWTNGGAPLMGDPQVGALSPIVNAFGLLSGEPSHGFVAYWLFSWWFGGLGMLLLGRHFGAPVWGSFVVSVGFLFCGIYTGNAEHTPWIVSFSFVPWILWRLDVALTSGSYLAAAEAGVLWGLAGLAGYPAIVLLTICYCALWAFGRALFDTPEGRSSTQSHSMLRYVAIMMILLVIGLITIFPTYVSFFVDGMGANNRTGALDRKSALGDEFPPGALATFASPYLTILNLRQSPRLWASTDGSMVNIYVGAIIPVAALLGLLLRPKVGWRWWIAGLAILSFCCAMGESLPFRGWLYDLLPPMRFFRHSAVFRLFGVLSLALLAMIAMCDIDKKIADECKSRRISIFYAAIFISIVASAAYFPIILTRPADVRGIASIMHFALLWGGLLTISAFVYLSESAARRAVTVLLFAALAAMDALVSSMFATPTVMSLRATRWHELDAKHTSALNRTNRGAFREFSACETIPLDGRCRKNDQLITKIPVLDAYSSDKSPWRIATAQDPVLRESATGTDRFWFSSFNTIARASDKNFAAFRERAHSLGKVPIIVHDDPVPTDKIVDVDSGLSSIHNAPPSIRLPARILKYSPRDLVFDVTSPGHGWLLVTDRWSPAWRVTVNGKEEPSRMANFIFRAVTVERGPNRVSYHYTPWAFPLPITVSWLVIFGIGLCRLASLPVKRMRPKEGC